MNFQTRRLRPSHKPWASSNGNTFQTERNLSSVCECWSVDSQNNVVLKLTRPAKFVKSRVVVEDGAGNTIGEITQKNALGKIKFGLNVGGVEMGSINAENWRAWNFNMQDANGTEIARITKTFEGVLKTAFTTADNYVVSVHHPLPDPLRQMVVAAALSIDTALKQDSRGFG